MSGLPFVPYFLFLHIYATIVFILFSFSPISTILSAQDREISDEMSHFEQDWVTRYFNAINEFTPIEEVVDFLVSLRTALVAKGYSCPILSDMWVNLVNQLVEDEIPLEDEEVDKVYDELIQREATIVDYRFRRTTHSFSSLVMQHCSHKNLKAQSKIIFGALKCLAGGFLCAIPNPAFQLAGASLIMSGIHECRENQSQKEPVIESLPF